MSTKALSKVLEFFLQRARHDEMALLDAAEAELEAIEKAARIVVCGKVYGGRQDEEAALALFEEIERQARESK